MLELNVYYNKYLAKCNCVINAINRHLAKEAKEPKTQEEQDLTIGNNYLLRYKINQCNKQLARQHTLNNNNKEVEEEFQESREYYNYKVTRAQAYLAHNRYSIIGLN